MARVIGGAAHRKRLQAMRGAGMVRGVTNALFKSAQDLQVEAQLLISEGAVSGKNHVPSRPGEPPNNDSGVLAGNIEAAVVGPLKAETSSNAPYAGIEFGIGAVEERPHLRPAAEKVREPNQRRVVDAVNRAIRSAA